MLKLTAAGDVVVLENHTRDDISFEITSSGDTVRHVIGWGDVLPIPVDGDVEIAFDCDDGSSRRYRLDANAAYRFSGKGKNSDLKRIAFTTLPKTTVSGKTYEPSMTSDPVGGLPEILRMGVVPVMVLVDEEERAARAMWEKRLRDRLKNASDIFEHHCGMRFRVITWGTWDSDDDHDFSAGLREFELEVIPDPAAVAIGFTSQHQIPTRSDPHLGGIRGPFRRHLLISEPLHLSEPERLEVLVHELGHLLGAVHCPDRYSVMRPNLGDARARAVEFRIAFDAPNTLAMYLVCNEVRSRGVFSFGQLTPMTKEHLRRIYKTMAEAVATDKTADYYFRLAEGRTPRPVKASYEQSLVNATRTVVIAIVDAARRHQGLSRDVRSEVPTGDRLLESCFRQAAEAAQSIPNPHAPRAFLLGLAAGLDDSATLRANPFTGPFFRQVESEAERSERIALVKGATMRGRRDVAQHFVVSCGLTALVGPSAAETAGILKELADSRRGSGFSFVDLTADLAGVVFASKLQEGEISLSALVSFRVTSFLPEVHLPEGISWSSFVSDYGSTQGERFRSKRNLIRDHVLTLPGYRKRNP